MPRGMDGDGGVWPHPSAAGGVSGISMHTSPAPRMGQLGLATPLEFVGAVPTAPAAADRRALTVPCWRAAGHDVATVPVRGV